MAMIQKGETFWRGHIEQLETSGLSRKKYAHVNELSYATLQYWVKKLKSVSTSSQLIPVKIQSCDEASPRATLCTFEIRGHLLHIHCLSAMTHLLDRMA